MPKFSIIVPVYNVESYLEESLNSIKNQTFRDFEVICINDGSTDSSLNILESFAAGDSRFRVYSQENQGQGVARNRALDLAEGECVVFVDPDDFIELNALELICERFERTNAEVIIFDFIRFYDDKKDRQIFRFRDLVAERMQYNIVPDVLWSWKDLNPDKSLVSFTRAVWEKAYSLEFIKGNNIRFALNKFGEDHIFCFQSILQANKICYLAEPLYNYRQRRGSAVSSASDNRFCMFENVKMLKDFLIKHSLYSMFETGYSRYLVDTLSSVYVGIPTTSRQSYLELIQQELTADEYKMFLERITPRHSILENILSFKNRKENGQRVKVLRLLGMEFVLNKK